MTSTNKPIFFLDFDGCIANSAKIWYEKPDKKLPGRPHFLNRGNISVMKAISDHDSWAIDVVKKNAHICVFSGDTRINESWCVDRRGIDFVFTSKDKAHTDKWKHIQHYWIDKNWSPGPEGQYYYLGDAIPDFKALANSKMGFMPADASFTLQERTEGMDHIIKLPVISGHGVFEFMVNFLIAQGEVSKEILDE